jgi:hypothetical protein
VGCNSGECSWGGVARGGEKCIVGPEGRWFDVSKRNDFIIAAAAAIDWLGGKKCIAGPDGRWRDGRKRSGFIVVSVVVVVVVALAIEWLDGGHSGHNENESEDRK